jgi:hypothetical protein
MLYLKMIGRRRRYGDSTMNVDEAEALFPATSCAETDAVCVPSVNEMVGR